MDSHRRNETELRQREIWASGGKTFLLYLSFRNYTPECHYFLREVRGVFYIGTFSCQMERTCWLYTWGNDLAKRILSTHRFYYFNVPLIFLRKYLALNLVLAVFPTIATTWGCFALFKQSKMNPSVVSHSYNDYHFFVMKVNNVETQARQMCLPVNCLIIKCTLFQMIARGFDN